MRSDDLEGGGIFTPPRPGSPRTRSPSTEGAERNHRQGRPCQGPKNSGKNRRGGRNPRAKKRRPREGPAFGFPFLNWWRWWELKSDTRYPKSHDFESCRGGMCMRSPDAVAPSGKERHELAHKTGTNSGQFRRGTRGEGVGRKRAGGISNRSSPSKQILQRCLPPVWMPTTPRGLFLSAVPRERPQMQRNRPSAGPAHPPLARRLAPSSGF
jgi:hypothetical protein